MMELVNQHTKNIMEGCKKRARDAGLIFNDETLEYIVTNRDLLELSPKLMIPTLYDYWVHDVQVLREKGRYELYPYNPYETVINTRPAISFYNDNNPDWLNVMIFYHVLAHMDFFQNNLFFRHTWDYDFTGQALSDKRLIAQLRSEKGRWVDYVIEFARGIDNIVGYYQELSRLDSFPSTTLSKRMNFYFDVFLQSQKKLTVSEYIKEVERYNACVKDDGPLGEASFFKEVDTKFPEFKALFKKSLDQKPKGKMDLLLFLMSHSPFLDKEENTWMKSVLQVVRNTSIFFQPQIRTKIMNEGWASYWHEILFLQDNRIEGREIDFAKVNAGVTNMPRVGLNPYALGMRLFYHIEEMADKGRLSVAFERISDIEKRKQFDETTGKGREFIFQVRQNISDFLFIKNFVDQDFVNRNKLFVSGRRLKRAKSVWEYYVKSRDAEEYRKMLFNSLYHPPCIEIMADKGDEGALYLFHHFEEKPLVHEFIPNTMLGIEYLWGSPVQLETSEVLPSEDPKDKKIKWQRVLYTMKEGKISKTNV